MEAVFIVSSSSLSVGDKIHVWLERNIVIALVKSTVVIFGLLHRDVPIYQDDRRTTTNERFISREIPQLQKAECNERGPPAA